MLKILLVDDHEAVRRGLQRILREGLGETVFGEAASAREALHLSAQASWDLVLLDASLPDRCGLDILKELTRQRRAPVLVVSLYSETLYVFFALKFGAMGYIAKQSVSEELVDAVRKVLSGGRYISLALAEKMAIRLDGESDAAAHETLGSREFQVLLCLASGLSLKEAAVRLSLSPKTVSGYRARLFEKLKLKTSAELAQYAALHGLLEPEISP